MHVIAHLRNLIDRVGHGVLPWCLFAGIVGFAMAGCALRTANSDWLTATTLPAWIQVLGSLATLAVALIISRLDARDQREQEGFRRARQLHNIGYSVFYARVALSEAKRGIYSERDLFEYYIGTFDAHVSTIQNLPTLDLPDAVVFNRLAEALKLIEVFRDEFTVYRGGHNDQPRVIRAVERVEQRLLEIEGLIATKSVQLKLPIEIGDGPLEAKSSYCFGRRD